MSRRLKDWAASAPFSAVPMLREGIPIGVFEFDFAEPVRPFTQKQIEAGQHVGRLQAAIAIEGCSRY